MTRAAYVLDESLGVELLAVDLRAGDTFQIQLALAFDEQDSELGMDTYCLVHHAATYYGGIASWHLAVNKLVLLLTADAASALALPTVMEIPLDADGLVLFRTHLTRLTGLLPEP